MAQHAVRMVQRVMTPGGDKNGADINLALDALEMAFTHSHINAFVIVGGDSDFITLVEKLKQYDRKVFVVGGRAFTSQVMQKNCTEFIAYENVVPDRGHVSRAAETTNAASARAPARPPARSRIETRRPAGQARVEGADRSRSHAAARPAQEHAAAARLVVLGARLRRRAASATLPTSSRNQGLVTLKHQGRSTLVELPDGESLEARGSAGHRCAGHQLEPSNLTELLEQPDSTPQEPVQRDAVARRRRRARQARAGRSHHAAALADVSATVQAVPSHCAAGLRRAQLRIDRRPDARVPEGRPAASRARSSGRAPRVRQRRTGARLSAAWLGSRTPRRRYGGGARRTRSRHVADVGSRARRGPIRIRRRLSKRKSRSCRRADGRRTSPKAKRATKAKKAVKRKTAPSKKRA